MAQTTVNKYTLSFPAYYSQYVTFYEAIANISVSRTFGKNKIIVNVDLPRSSTGDYSFWNLYIGDSTTSYTEFRYQGEFYDDSTGSYYGHYSGYSYTRGLSQVSFDVGKTNGTKRIYIGFGIEGSGEIQWQNIVVQYGSIGLADLTSATSCYYKEASSFEFEIYDASYKYQFAIIRNGTRIFFSGLKSYSAGTNTWSWGMTSTKFLEYYKTTLQLSLTIELQTWSKDGKTFYGSTKKDIKLRLPDTDEYRPSITLNSISGKDENFGKYLSGISKFIAAVTVTPKYETTIKSVEMTISGVSVAGGSYSGSVNTHSTEAQNVNIASEILKFSKSAITLATFFYTIEVTDARGLKASTTASTQVLCYYVAPKISNFNLSITDPSIKVTASYNFDSYNGLENTYAWKLDRKISDESEWTNVVDRTTLSGISGNIEFYDNAPEADIKTYEYRLTLIDKKTEVQAIKSTGIPAISILGGGKGVRFFGEAEDGDLKSVVCYVPSGQGKFRVYQGNNNELLDMRITSSGSAGLALNDEWIIVRDFNTGIVGSPKLNLVKSNLKSISGTGQVNKYSVLGTSLYEESRIIILAKVSTTDEATGYIGMPFIHNGRIYLKVVTWNSQNENAPFKQLAENTSVNYTIYYI